MSALTSVNQVRTCCNSYTSALTTVQSQNYLYVLEGLERAIKGKFLKFSSIMNSKHFIGYDGDYPILDTLLLRGEITSSPLSFYVMDNLYPENVLMASYSPAATLSSGTIPPTTVFTGIWTCYDDCEVEIVV